MVKPQPKLVRINMAVRGQLLEKGVWRSRDATDVCDAPRSHVIPIDTRKVPNNLAHDNITSSQFTLF